MTLVSFIDRINWRGRFIRYAPLLLWIAVIFAASSTIGASDNTSRFIRPFLEWLLPNSSPDSITVIHGYIRKLAHFTEYAFLAFFAFRAFANSRIRVARTFWYVWTFLTVVGVAGFDEFNQSRNPARTGSIYDVMIDCAGAAAMILAVAVFRRLRSGVAPRP